MLFLPIISIAGALGPRSHVGPLPDLDSVQLLSSSFFRSRNMFFFVFFIFFLLSIIIFFSSSSYTDAQRTLGRVDNMPLSLLLFVSNKSQCRWHGHWPRHSHKSRSCVVLYYYSSIARSIVFHYFLTCLSRSPGREAIVFRFFTLIIIISSLPRAT